MFGSITMHFHSFYARQHLLLSAYTIAIVILPVCLPPTFRAR